MFTRIKPDNIRLLRKNMVGIDRKVPIGGHKQTRYIYFDNAASTPALVPVVEEITDYLSWYSGVHRGTGYKSLISSKIYNQCHEIIGQFVGADPTRDTVIMVKNTTEAINKLSYRLQLRPSDVVITTDMEHHSNDLPWKAKAAVKYAGLNQYGELNTADVRDCLQKNYPRVKLLAVCGASNVTGHVNNVHLLAKMAHEYGCKILVDGAQLIPHRRFSMKSYSDPGHIDFLAFSGHKMYAPFGAGVLIGPKEIFANNPPEYQGGGTVKLVMKDRIYWAEPPDSEEAGSANVIGTYALAKTMNFLEKIGMDNIVKHEDELTDYALKKIQALRNVVVYGSKSRIGVISFNIKGISHSLAGAVLCFEAGIGTRTGCFCAQNYVRKLLGQAESSQHIKLYEQNQLDKLPGMVRISLGGYNTFEEVDYFIKWLEKLVQNKSEFAERYQYDPEQGSFVPKDIPEACEFIDSQISALMDGVRY
ncbi:MAG TPA: aminotransferase class V-fold PLP-dependent enzyme [Syntrophomonadaceae bacterium]|nr:aminotransferase class V-fold PLP-dependent enzyme [Syntrophomonadaceae bacterium]